MAVLITGGLGFIGSHLSEGLLNKGEKIVVLDNYDPFYSKSLKEANKAEIEKGASENFVFIDGDIRDGALVDKIFSEQNITDVVHLAALAGVRPSIERPLDYVNVNLDGTAQLLEAARKYKLDRFLFASSSSVYGSRKEVPFRETDNVDHPISPYAATKVSGERLMSTYSHLFNMRIISLRFFTVYGPRQRPDLAINKFTRLIDEGKSIPFFGDGSTARDYTYVLDILDGVMKALDYLREERDPFHEIINLGESDTTTLSELVQLIEEAVGKKAVLDKQPVQAGDVPLTNADISKAKSLIGYAPKTPIAQGIKKFVEWYKSKQ